MSRLTDEGGDAAVGGVKPAGTDAAVAAHARLPETITLLDGLRVGDTVHTVVTMRLPMAGDIIDAGIEAERMVMTQDGPLLLLSPTLTAQHCLRRQVVSIGSHKGPLTFAELRALSGRDLEMLQQRASDLDAALLGALDARGRAQAPGAGAGGR